jgi:cell division protein FtsI/penicillin-binding protein 2
MQSAQRQGIQQDMLRRRIPFFIGGVVIASALLLLRVIAFQFPQDPRVVSEFSAQRDANTGSLERIESSRGRIFDRDGEPLAVNTRLFRVGISPNLVSNPEQTARDLAAILDRDALELYNIILSDVQYVVLGVVEPEVWQQIDALNLFAIQADRLQRRVYPQGTLGSQVVGFVGGEGFGVVGVEAYREGELAGRVGEEEVSNIPLGLPEDLASLLSDGTDIVLTLDRDIQFLTEQILQQAVQQYEATGGTIIVMDPRNGDILAMANYPTFDPNAYSEVENEEFYNNPAVSAAYEPGSVFKVITVSAALQSGIITPDWSYNDQGRIDDVGGVVIENWDKQAYGLTSLQNVLVNSLNVGTATISRTMGPEMFYAMVRQFGIGSLTQVDLAGEIPGTLRVPGDPIWSESDLLTNSFGQGVSVTPLQMLLAVNAIANDGTMMQPRVLLQYYDGTEVYQVLPNGLSDPISPETANLVTDMMVAAVRDGLDDEAQLPGYTVAGKTGTAEIFDVVDYLDDAWIMTFVGFLPADDPQVSVLIKLDRPQVGRWASQVAAPVFRQLAERLVILLEIPNDDVRLRLNETAGR